MTEARKIQVGDIVRRNKSDGDLLLVLVSERESGVGCYQSIHMISLVSGRKEYWSAPPTCTTWNLVAR